MENMAERAEDQQKKNTVRWQKLPRAARIAIPVLLLLLGLGFALAGPAQALYHTNRAGALLAETLEDDPLAIACARDPLPQGEQRERLEEALRALQTAIGADAGAAQVYLDMSHVLCMLD